jgi:hypothetical protein
MLISIASYPLAVVLYGQSLADVRKIYVGDLGNDLIRQKIIVRLASSSLGVL